MYNVDKRSVRTIMGFHTSVWSYTQHWTGGEGGTAFYWTIMFENVEIWCFLTLSHLFLHRIVAILTETNHVYPITGSGNISNQ